MPIGPNSASVRIFLPEEDVELRNKFKQLVAIAGTSMSKRMALFMEKDVAYWEATGKILDVEAFDVERSEKLDRLDELMDKLNYLISILQPETHQETNGHHPTRQVKTTQPIDDELDEEDDGEVMKLKVAYPKRNHKAYKGRVGEMAGEVFEEEKVILRFSDGEEVIFLDEELELASHKDSLP